MDYLQQLLSSTKNLNIDCEYWDVRIEDIFETAIDIIDGEVATCTSSPSLGAFLRVRKNGFWFYQSTTQLNKIPESLIELSKQKSTVTSNFKYNPEKQKSFSKILSADFKVSSVSLENKLELCKKYYEVVKLNKKCVSSRIGYKDIYKVKSFLNSAGTEFEFDFNQAGIAVRYTLKENANIFDDKCLFYASQFDQLKNKEKEINNSLVKSEVFLNAPAIVPGKYSVLFDPEVTGVFTHESFGHKSEADFILGDAKALEDWKLGSEVGSKGLNIVDYGGHENTSGYCPIDDDGTLAQKNYLIKDGLLSGRLHSIDTAIQLNERPTGNSRAMNFEFEPIVRMTSTYIEPGTESIDSILQKSEGAILVEGV